MAIPEQQLATWSHPGAKAQSASTYEIIKRALNDSDAPYYKYYYHIFLQGSYGNDTNIHDDSDVDIAMCLTSVYYDDIQHLEDDERARYKANWTAGGYSFDQFKAEVFTWLKLKFGPGVKAGNKAIFVPGDGSRRDADVLVCVTHKTFTSYRSSTDNTFWDGICFWTAGGDKIVNYPLQHLANCTTMHESTLRRFKPNIRVIKNMRNAMIDRRLIPDGLAPSYFLEGMLSNVPSQNFKNSYQQTFENYMQWLQTCPTNDLTCANDIHYLLREGHSVCWNLADFNAFRAAAIRFWNMP